MNKKTVIVTPAGRRRYMRILVPQVLSSPGVDRYDIWVNTENIRDIAFLEGVARHPKVRLIRQPDGKANGNASINAFFRHACDEDSIYIRFDDDVVWMEESTISGLARFRIDNPRYFLVSPIVVNNAVCTSLLQKRGKLSDFPVVSPYCLDVMGWRDPAFAKRLHERFLSALSSGDISEFRTSDAQIAFGRFSINCISWLGSDLKKYNGVVLGDEEESLSVDMPLKESRLNCFVGNLTVSHFSFFTQRDIMDESEILDMYGDVLRKADWISPDIVKMVEESHLAAERIDSRSLEVVSPSGVEPEVEKRDAATAPSLPFKLLAEAFGTLSKATRVATFKVTADLIWNFGLEIASWGQIKRQ